MDGETAAQARVIEAWSDFKKEYGDDTLIVTRRNADAASLNRAARATLRTEGRLKSDDVIVPTMDRKGKTRNLPIAIGDKIRFGETLNNFGIRNGTRAVISAMQIDDDGLRVSFQLDDGRVVSDQWAAFVRPRLGKRPKSPRVSHAYAGTAYAAQGRTVKAAVLYVAQPTDARELYVGLTRHTQDARLIVERGRLDAAVRRKQVDPRVPATQPAMFERFFVEARRYAEKRNVIDFVEDRIGFISNGVIPPPTRDAVLNVSRVAKSARLIALMQAEFSRVTSIYQAIWHMTAMVQGRAKDAIRPIEKRVRKLLNPQYVGVSETQAKDGPDRWR